MDVREIESRAKDSQLGMLTGNVDFQGATHQAIRWLRFFADDLKDVLEDFRIRYVPALSAIGVRASGSGESPVYHIVVREAEVRFNALDVRKVESRAKDFQLGMLTGVIDFQGSAHQSI